MSMFILLNPISTIFLSLDFTQISIEFVINIDVEEFYNDQFNGSNEAASASTNGEENSNNENDDRRHTKRQKWDDLFFARPSSDESDEALMLWLLDVLEVTDRPAENN